MKTFMKSITTKYKFSIYIRSQHKKILKMNILKINTLDTEIIHIADIAKLTLDEKKQPKITMLKESHLDILIEFYKGMKKLEYYKITEKSKKQYFINVHFNKENLTLLVLTNNEKIIIGFGIINQERFRYLQQYNFYQHDGYTMAKQSHKSTNLYELIYGKKSEKGGWKLVHKNEKELIKGEYVNKTKARWITNISGRSLNEHDPNPDNTDFLYYYDEENQMNIKIAEPNKWCEQIEKTEGNLEEPPTCKEGKPGDFYVTPTGKMYIKVGKFAIDHKNIRRYDDRSSNLREITVAANILNREQRPKRREYIGVQERETIWRSRIDLNSILHSRNFNSAIEAAKFYDYHLFAFYGLDDLPNNNSLSREEIEKVILNGFDAIPDEYQVEENKEQRELPKHISKSRNCYRLHLTYQSDTYFTKNYTTLQEAKDVLPIVLKSLEIKKEEDRLEERQKKGHYKDDKFGYMNIKGVIHKFDLETYEEFVDIEWNWTIDDPRPKGRYKGIAKSLHVHVYEIYFPNYDPIKEGSIDHADRDTTNLTISNLRPGTKTLQSQNADREGEFGYQGIRLSGLIFVAGYSDFGRKSYEYLEDALLSYNTFVDSDPRLNGNGKKHLIPQGLKRKMEDFYFKALLSEEIIDNATLDILFSIVSVNTDWKEKLYEEYQRKDLFQNDNCEFCRKLIKKLFLDYFNTDYENDRNRLENDYIEKIKIFLNENFLETKGTSFTFFLPTHLKDETVKSLLEGVKNKFSVDIQKYNKNKWEIIYIVTPIYIEKSREIQENMKYNRNNCIENTDKIFGPENNSKFERIKNGIFDERNAFERFFKEKLIFTGQENDKIQFDKLLKSYNEWANENRAIPFNKMNFANELSQRGFTKIILNFTFYTCIKFQVPLVEKELNRHNLEPVLRRFMEEKINFTNNILDKIESSYFHEEFTKYCNKNGQSAITATLLGRHLTKLGIQKQRGCHTHYLSMKFK